jgi:hypothetical protein
MPMTPERLRAILHDARISDANYSHGMAVDISEAERALAHRNELLEYVDELTRQLSDARRIAIDSGVFQNYQGTWYPEPGPKFTADPVGPVAWDRQVEQR